MFVVGGLVDRSAVPGTDSMAVDAMFAAALFRRDFKDERSWGRREGVLHFISSATYTSSNSSL